MLAILVTGWENRFPSTTHYHNCCRKAITNLYKFRPQIYQKVPAGKEKLSQPSGSFQLCRSLFSRHSFSICLPCSLSKNACIWGSNVRARLSTADCGIGSVLFSKTTRLADIPLFCSSLFLSQPRGKFGGGKRQLATPCSPPPSWEDYMPQSNMGSLPFQGFCGMI